MSAARQRLDTPIATGSQPVPTNLTDETTAPELAPPRRSTPALPPPVRARRSTLVSPIPALLAAKMKAREEIDTARRLLNDGTPAPVDVRADVTSRLTDEDRESILMESDADYLVEVDPQASEP